MSESKYESESESEFDDDAEAYLEASGPTREYRIIQKMTPEQLGIAGFSNDFSITDAQFIEYDKTRKKELFEDETGRLSTGIADYVNRFADKFPGGAGEAVCGEIKGFPEVWLRKVSDRDKCYVDFVSLLLDKVYEKVEADNLVIGCEPGFSGPFSNWELKIRKKPKTSRDKIQDVLDRQ